MDRLVHPLRIRREIMQASKIDIETELADGMAPS